jgi:hypothetical protein
MNVVKNGSLRERCDWRRKKGNAAQSGSCIDYVNYSPPGNPTDVLREQPVEFTAVIYRSVKMDEGKSIPVLVAI